MNDLYLNFDNYDSKKDLFEFWGTQDVDDITAAFLAGKDMSQEI